MNHQWSEENRGCYSCTLPIVVSSLIEENRGGRSSALPIVVSSLIGENRGGRSSTLPIVVSSLIVENRGGRSSALPIVVSSLIGENRGCSSSALPIVVSSLIGESRGCRSSALPIDFFASCLINSDIQYITFRNVCKLEHFRKVQCSTRNKFWEAYWIFFYFLERRRSFNRNTNSKWIPAWRWKQFSLIFNSHRGN